MYKENYTTCRDDDFFKESETYMYLGGGEVGHQRPQWVVIKHDSLTRRMHKIIYISVIKSMGGLKIYLHIQRKLYYMEGQ